MEEAEDSFTRVGSGGCVSGSEAARGVFLDADVWLWKLGHKRRAIWGCERVGSIRAAPWRVIAAGEPASKVPAKARR